MTTPRKLSQALKNSRSQRQAARTLGVNQYYISRWLKYKEEPTNKAIRQKMGFPPLRKKHNGRSGFAELPEHIKWWRKLDKGSRDQYIRNTYDYIVTVQ